MSFRRPNYNIFPSPLHRVFGGGSLLMEPWMNQQPVMPASLLGTRPFETSLVSSVLNILEPFELLDRVDRMISRWIGGAFRRQVPIRRRRPFRFGRAVRPVIQAAPIRRRRVQRARRVPVSVVQRPMQQQQRPRQMRQQRRRAVSQQRPVMQQQPMQRRPRSLQQQPVGGKQIGGGIRKQPQQPAITKQLPIQQQPKQLKQKLPQPQQQPAGQMGKQLPVKPTVGKQMKQMPSLGRQVPIQQQVGGKQQLPIQTTGGKQQKPQKQTQVSSLGRQVPIQQAGGVKQPKQPAAAALTPTSGGVGKLTKAASAVTGASLPQLYRICLRCEDCSPADIKCSIQEGAAGQCNLIITGCGPYKRCYTLPSGCDRKKLKKSATGQNMCVIECPLLEAPRCLDIDTQPQIKQDSVSLKVKIPEFIEPNKVKLHLKGNDLIMCFEAKIVPTQDVACRVLYYNKVTLPANTNLDMLKCSCVKGCLCITAPIMGQRQKQPQQVTGKQQQQVIQPEAGKKMRHRKLMRMQQGGIQQQPLKGAQPTAQPAAVQKQPQQKAKLPKPEEISIGGKKQPTGKAAPGAPVTPATTPVKPKKEKKKPTETPITPQVEPSKVQDVKEAAKPTKKTTKKPKSGGEVKQGPISGSQKLHEIFASSGTSASQPTEQQQGQPQQQQSSESMGRPVSPIKQ